jgi:dipeptidyl-peptidase-4
MEFHFQRRITIQLVLLSVSFFSTKEITAQGARSDYERAFNLRKVTANKVYKQRVNPNWFSDSKRFWYRNDLADEAREYILVNAEAGTRRRAFDHKRLAGALAEATGEKIQADRLPVGKL